MSVLWLVIAVSLSILAVILGLMLLVERISDSVLKKYFRAKSKFLGQFNEKEND